MALDGNGIAYHDPHFLNMLEACLRMEITVCRRVLAVRKEAIRKIKMEVRAQLSKRKQVKERTKQAQDNALVLNAVLKKSHGRLVKTSIAIDFAKANTDDAYRLTTLEKQRYRTIVANYQDTWEAYGTKYEEFPLARTKNEAKTSLEMLRVEKMVVEYKITRLAKILKRQDDVAWLRTRAKVIEFATVVSSNAKTRTKLATLRSDLASHRAELESIAAEIRESRKRKEEAEKTRLLNLLIMPPPKINLSQMRLLTMPKRQQASITDRWKYCGETSSDSMSVNSITLEEMCMTEDEPMRATQIVSHGSDLDSASRNRAVAGGDSSAEDEEEAEGEALGEEESARATTSHGPPVGGTDSKRSALQGGGQGYDDRDASGPKRMKLNVRESEVEGRAMPSPRVLREAAGGHRTAVPRIRQIEAVDYDAASSALRLAGNNVRSSSMFSPQLFERYRSHASSIMDMERAPPREQTAVREGYTCNYNFSECSNISLPFSTNQDARDEAFASRRIDFKEGGKQSPRNFKQIDFSNVLKNRQGPASFF